MVTMTKVESSNVAAIGYDAAAQHLYVEYIKSGTYRYSNVPAEIYNDWMAAESKGKFFHEKVKGRYDYALIEKHT